MIEEQEPMPMEGWVHISVAIEAGALQDQAPERTLAQMGVNGADWQRVDTFWQAKMSAGQPELSQVHERYLRRIGRQGHGATTLAHMPRDGRRRGRSAERVGRVGDGILVRLGSNDLA